MCNRGTHVEIKNRFPFTGQSELREDRDVCFSNPVANQVQAVAVKTLTLSHVMSRTFAALAYSNVDVESEDSKKNPLLILRKSFSDLDRTACWTNYNLDSALREVDLKSGVLYTHALGLSGEPDGDCPRFALF